MAISPKAVVFFFVSIICVSGQNIWNFDSDEVGKIPPGFTSISGEWNVAVDNSAPSAPNVLAQTGEDTYNLVLLDDLSYKDLDISVKVKAISGGWDKGGGFVWRAKDDKNYYVIRYNPGEDFQPIDVRKMVNGQREMIAKTANITCDEEWHTVRVTMEESKMKIFFDNEEILDADDSEFPEAGKVGMWSKAEAVSNFDDFTVIDLSTDVKLIKNSAKNTFFFLKNYPNPFTLTTELYFNLLKPGYINLSVHDLQGKLIALLVNGKKDIGNHKVKWNCLDKNGNTLPVGLYFAHLNTGNNIKTIRMNLIK